MRHSAALTIVMLAWTEGVQRWGRELADILSTSGFDEITVTPSFGYWRIVSGRKPRA